MKKTYLIFLLFIFLFTGKNFATHIVGGEMYYDWLGGNNYKITLKVYRDCYNGIPPFDSVAYIFAFDVSGNLVDTLSIPVPPSTLIPPSINNPCFTPPNDVCVEEAVYIDTVNLPPSFGGYTLCYQRCCRNITALNLVSPGDLGATYFCHIPGPEVVSVNSEPRFTYFPPIFICNDIPIDFNHSAFDPDGDSLAYKLCDPYNGLDPCCGFINPYGPLVVPTASPACPIPPPFCPQVASPPPYTPVPFLSPYSGAYPLSSSPAININTNTGLLTGVPNLSGQWVVGVCVEEWRNGVLIGTHHREFQFNVVPCPGLIASSILNQSTFCFGFQVNFQNQSSNSNSYLWNFGDPTTLADTSHAFQPSYTYPDTGHYTVMLIAEPYTPCADTAIQVFEIFPVLNPSFVNPGGQCITGNSFNFNAGGTFAGNGTFQWSFGTVATPSVSGAQNPTGISFSQSGTWLVALTVSENSCTASYYDSVEVYPVPQADFNAAPLSGCVPFFAQFYDSSIVGTTASYLWDFGDGQTSTLNSPSHIYNNAGVYTVSLTIITSSGCVDTSTFVIPNMVSVQASPLAGFTANPLSASIFEPWITFTDQSSGGVVSWQYVFGDGFGDTVPDPQHTYTNYGNFNVTQIVSNSNGCPDTAYLTVEIYPEYRFWIPNAFTPFNNDNLNSVFKPVVFGVNEYEFAVFDRWGELIYKTQDPDEGWNGMYKNHKCQEDVYVWKCAYWNLIDQTWHTHVGKVTLLR